MKKLMIITAAALISCLCAALNADTAGAFISAEAAFSRFPGERRTATVDNAEDIWDGITSDSVRLKSSAPLIDLSLYVRDSDPGHGGNPETGLDDNAASPTAQENSSSSADTPADDPFRPGTSTLQDEVTELRIEVNGTSVLLNGSRCGGTSGLRYRLKNMYRYGMVVRLIDDYADAAVYKDVLRTLDELLIEPVEERS